MLELSQRKRNELAQLLKRTTLSAIISAAKLVADRLNFLLGLETILFDQDLKKTLKERSQLHRILADNTWIFGEEFALTVDDQSLTEVLRQHLKNSKRDIVVDEPVKRLDESTGIIDLMLSRRVPTARAEEHEHLVVELKAPKVKIGLTETGQIKSYAFAVIGDERFRAVPARWTFWVVSNDLDLNADKEVHQANKPEGLLWEGDEIEARIWIKTWSQIINDCRTRLQIFQKELNHSAEREDSLAYLKEAYARTLQVNQTDDEPEESGGTQSAKSSEAVAG